MHSNLKYIDSQDYYYIEPNEDMSDLDRFEEWIANLKDPKIAYSPDQCTWCVTEGDEYGFIDLSDNRVRIVYGKKSKHDYPVLTESNRILDELHKVVSDTLTDLRLGWELRDRKVLEESHEIKEDDLRVIYESDENLVILWVPKDWILNIDKMDPLNIHSPEEYFYGESRELYPDEFIIIKSALISYFYSRI